MGARAKVTGVASHHHTAAIAISDNARRASGVRREIGPVSRKSRRLARVPGYAKSLEPTAPVLLAAPLYQNRSKFPPRWTKMQMSVM